MKEKWEHAGNGVRSGIVMTLAVACSLAVHALGVDNESIIMIYLLGVLFTTVFTSSRRWGIGVSLIYVMFFNFFFTEPQYTFLINSTGDLLLLGFFLVTAIVSGTVTSRLQHEREVSSQNEQTAGILYRIASGFLS